MNNYIHLLLFGVYPYIAIAVFLIGSWMRFDYDPYTWRTGSSQLLSNKWMRLGSNWFHIGIIAVLGGHFVGLLTPHTVYEPIISSGNKQLVAIVVGGLFGLMCLVGMTLLLIRRLTNVRIKTTGARRDLLVLVLLYVQLLLGLSSIYVSAGHLDGKQMLMLAGWAQHVVTFRSGAADLIADAHWIFKAHIFLGLTLILIFPFTRLVHVWSIPLAYLRRPYQIVRRRSPSLRYGEK